MKIKRNKEIRKTLRFYKTCFNHHEPYRILIDLSFIEAALQGRIKIKDQLPVMLCGKVNLMTTDCVLKEIKAGGSKMRGPDIVAQPFFAFHCGCPEGTTSAECFLRYVGQTNEKLACIASQDRKLQSQMRRVGGVPILFIHNQVPCLEPPSEESKSIANMKEREGRGIQAWEKGSKDDTDEATPIKKKKKNPNPLSVKKKIVKVPEQSAGGKRTRRKKRTRSESE